MRAAGRNPNGDNSRNQFVGVGQDFLRSRQDFRYWPHFYSATLSRGFDLGNQFLCNLWHAGRDIVGLGNKIESTHRQRLQGNGGAFGTV